MTSYKEALTSANTILSQNELVRFVGYGIKKNRALGTLAEVELSKIIETPTAENLLVGFGIGLALQDLVPVVFIERMDFILNALDALVNHLDKINEMSSGEFKPAMIIRVIVGNREKPLFTGATHTQDFYEALRSMIKFPIFRLQTVSDINKYYAVAYQNIEAGQSTILIEYKDLI
jgi:pyruvate/2-oxoglutarate/acetoin dehydrogenase E1 component